MAKDKSLECKGSPGPPPTDGGLLDEGRRGGAEAVHQAAQLLQGTHHHVLAGRHVRRPGLVIPAGVAHHGLCGGGSEAVVVVVVVVVVVEGDMVSKVNNNNTR